MLNTCVPYELAIPHLSIYQKKMHIYVFKKMYKIAHSQSIYNSCNMEIIKISIKCMMNT